MSANNRPLLFKNGIVLTMDNAHTLHQKGDVLIIDGVIKEVGPNVAAPADAEVIDASGGIIMPGMIDTHRHMWQTAMRGYGADWTLSQYFVWYYLSHGKSFRPQDIYAGNLLAAVEAIDAGVTTCVDWSHGLQTIEHADAAVDALEAVPGRFVLAYGNIQAGPWVPGDPAFPEKAAFEVARELGVGVTTHAGVWGATNDDGIRLMYENGFMNDNTVYVHAATLSDDSYNRIAATGGNASVSTESEQSAGQGYPPTWKLRQHGVEVSLSMDTSVWWSGDLFSAMRTTVGADRSREHLEAHAKKETVSQLHMRCEEAVDWATRGGSRALKMDSKIGSLEVGKRGDVVLVKNDDSPVMFPILNPYGHIVMQAQRGDVHTVVIDGKIVKRDHKLVDSKLAAAKKAVAETVEYLQSTMGKETWDAGMHPEIPDTKLNENPYTYTTFDSASADWKKK
jgi:5-methylthioadenosine/S-adenosylhomocysteine deaminase